MEKATRSYLPLLQLVFVFATCFLLSRNVYAPTGPLQYLDTCSTISSLGIYIVNSFGTLEKRGYTHPPSQETKGNKLTNLALSVSTRIATLPPCSLLT